MRLNVTRREWLAGAAAAALVHPELARAAPKALHDIAAERGIAFGTYVYADLIDKDPQLAPVSGGSGHTSACWLPPEMVGVGLAMDTARQRHAEAHRTDRARRLPGVRAALEAAPAHV